MAKTIEVDNKLINTITEGTVVRGNITSPGDFRIDGILEGNIVINGKLVIDRNGKVIGDISCQNANVIGSVEGNIRVNELLSLNSTASIKGDLVVNKLSIEPGASFTGSCKMFDEIKDN
ncbi:MAG: polymer-forming cytoskeletal protein [Bacteroidales bacterium]|nr:polymer-forming cytoskeletal protein [Bacteroidales bacterium]